MSEFYQRLQGFKTAQGLNNEQLGSLINKSGDAFRMAIKRESLTELEMKELEKYFDSFEQDPSSIKVNEPLGYIKNKNGLLYEELANGRFKVEVPHVPYNAYSSFIEVFGDEYATKEAFGTKIFTVDHPGKGQYISFTTKNESMNGGGINDTPGGADILGRLLQKHHWKDGFRDSIYGWIIICHDGMFHKDIEGPDNEGNVKCRSRNPSPEFPEFDLNLNEVHTIWKVIKRTF